MIILGIETSCDETSAAVVKDGILLSNTISSQVVHYKFGGVVPELASRAHQTLIIPVVEETLKIANVNKEQLNGVAAVYGPGLIGSILVGLSFGKGLALSLGIPFVGINHLEGHIYSNLVEEPKPQFPFINLTISGGHTQIVLVRAPLEYSLLGQTRDDAVGEAFDKVAKMLGIGYPGGPLIDELAKEGNPTEIYFPRPYINDTSLDFSFSGLKTSVLYYLKKSEFKQNEEGEPALRVGSIERKIVADICASFQTSVVDVLIHKAITAAKSNKIGNITVAGGVAANSELRRRLKEESKRYNIEVHFPKGEYCTDNAAMIAMAGYDRLSKNLNSPLNLAAYPNLSLSLIG